MSGPLVLLALLGCPEGEPPPPPPPPAPAPAPPPEVTEGPTLTWPDRRFPLGRLLEVCADVVTTARITVDDGARRFEVGSEPGLCHAVPLLGLHPGREHAVSVALEGEGGSVTVDAGTFVTDPLPSPFPDRIVRDWDAARVQPGVRFVPLNGPREYLVGFDQDLEVAWLLVDASPGDVDWTPAGTLLLQFGPEVVEVDLLGRTLRQWSARGGDLPVAVELPVPDVSHEVVLRGDALYTVSRLAVEVDAYPRSYVDPTSLGPATIADNLVAELDPATGEGRWSLVLGDLLDRGRIGYDSLEDEFIGLDWAHCNALEVSRDGRRFLASLRHQDALVAFDRAGRIDWILAPPDNWRRDLAAKLLTPVGADFEHSWHPHAPEWDEATGEVLVFDNGNWRASPYTGIPRLEPGESWSRVVGYRVDEEARTVTQEWSFAELRDGRVFSGSRGDVDRLPNGNVLGTWADVRYREGVPLSAFGLATPAIRLVELAFAPDPEVVLDLELSSPADGAGGWSTYRTEFVEAPFPRAAP